MEVKTIEFRDLTAKEVEVKKARGGLLLLYKTARVDANILDETVGNCGWQKLYEEKDGKIYCRIGINVDGTWLWKEDCGEETAIEAAKGEASDAMKRAGFAWGIGRKLYNGPLIKDPNTADKDAKYYVRDISFTKTGVDKVTIVDMKGKVVFTNHKAAATTTASTSEPVSLYMKVLAEVNKTNKKEELSAIFSKYKGSLTKDERKQLVKLITDKVNNAA